MTRAYFFHWLVLKAEWFPGSWATQLFDDGMLDWCRRLHKNLALYTHTHPLSVYHSNTRTLLLPLTLTHTDTHTCPAFRTNWNLPLPKMFPWYLNRRRQSNARSLSQRTPDFWGNNCDQFFCCVYFLLAQHVWLQLERQFFEDESWNHFSVEITTEKRKFTLNFANDQSGIDPLK